MARKVRNIDALLRQWDYQPGQPIVRRATGSDQRDLLQIRVDMGVLQMEVTDRPDGHRPEGFPTYYEYLVAASFEEGPDFELDEERCSEIDREFYQFYHRRIAWLTLKEFGNAVADAEHSLRLMDFSSANAPDAQWALLHEQYRPFVMFHRTQAAALSELESTEPRTAVEILDEGLAALEHVFEEHDAADRFDDDLFVSKLREMRTSVMEHYEIGPTLAEQLANAIAAEQYELAAQLRDQLGESDQN
ncbi:UvrB/UvrC motif-containing protein [Adhaeretor mobilis]|uniref:UvrB/uvrC motif protein n=1 Tax=Adhaeretor mobilis TaxID=1930276 RepID=A0A517MY81_9BACT|nr:UvrB/UvrC motif-containing protein [Adhaeretor mobilis]QDS99828.1 UvrB/uvrC motif protein [Adhaeretor mobilis]